jgi:PIN domain nuclease of toxin-antitoxin system
MTSLLIDTQAFIWMFSEPKRLTEPAVKLMQGASLLVSMASPWEMMIKFTTGKLHINNPPDLIVEEHRRTGIITLLPIALPHISALRALPYHHRDPFDRIIIAQALAENLPVVSSDAAFDAYGVQRVWE